MFVLVKLSTSLRHAVPQYNPHNGISVDVPAGATAQDIAVALGLPLDEIKVVMINGRQGALEQPLFSDDRVAFFPAVGGG